MSLYTWEICGARRVARKARGKFWDDLTLGLIPTHTLLATSTDAQSLLIIDCSAIEESGKSLVECDSKGTRRKSSRLPFNSIFACVALSQKIIVVIAEHQNEPGRVGVWQGPWLSDAWTKVFSLNAPKGYAESVSTDGVNVVVSNDGEVFVSGASASLFRGDCPRVSPDRQFFYLRDANHFPKLYEWPTMREVPIRYRQQVGTCAEWSPGGRWLLLETSGLLLPRLKVVDLVAGTEFDVGNAVITGSSGTRFRWIDWGVTGPEGINLIGLNY